MIPSMGCLYNNNVVADPLFCDPDNGDYRLMDGSPCLPDSPNAICPGYQIGPFGVGCSPVRTEQRTWGSVKSLYRE